MDSDMEGKSWDLGVRATEGIPVQPLPALRPSAIILSFLLLIHKMRIIIPAS